MHVLSFQILKIGYLIEPNSSISLFNGLVRPGNCKKNWKKKLIKLN